MFPAECVGGGACVCARPVFTRMLLAVVLCACLTAAAASGNRTAPASTFFYSLKREGAVRGTHTHTHAARCGSSACPRPPPPLPPACVCARHLAQGHPSSRDYSYRRLTPLEEVNVHGDFRVLAYYYADVYLGTPPQKVTAIADTGSTLLAFPCRDCADCGQHRDPPYDPTRSSTSRPLACAGGCPSSSQCASSRCTYSVSYAEGSTIAGNYFQDVVWIGDEKHRSERDGANFGTQFKFGCHQRETSA